MTNTKQEEFLEKLKDPIRANIKQICTEFIDNYSVESFCIQKIDNLYVVDLFADTHDILVTASKIFTSKVLAANNHDISVRNLVSPVPYKNKYSYTYYINPI